VEISEPRRKSPSPQPIQLSQTGQVPKRTALSDQRSFPPSTTGSAESQSKSQIAIAQPQPADAGATGMPFFRPQDLGPQVPEAGDFPFNVPREVVAFGADLITQRMEVGLHSHRKAELVLTLRGVVTCEAEQGVWIAPPRCAVWIPSGVPHGITLAGDVELYCLFVEPDAAPTLPTHCSTLSISPLLRHLLIGAARLPELYDVDGPDGRLVTVLLDQLAVAPIEDLNIPMPDNLKLRAIAAAIIADPADRATIDVWGQRVGISPRTLTRLLQRETGMSFGRWRQRLHIVMALQRLAQGASVQSVALDLGYESSSAFVTMFRKALGKSPTRYLAEGDLASFGALDEDIAGQ
jgi:AraC-like DNA-binding protein